MVCLPRVRCRLILIGWESNKPLLEVNLSHLGHWSSLLKLSYLGGVRFPIRGQGDKRVHSELADLTFSAPSPMAVESSVQISATNTLQHVINIRTRKQKKSLTFLHKELGLCSLAGMLACEALPLSHVPFSGCIWDTSSVYCLCWSWGPQILWFLTWSSLFSTREHSYQLEL